MNLADIIDDHPDDLVALITRGREATYGELRDRVDRLRGGFASVGLEEGDRIALLCGNGKPFVVAYLAALGLGAVVVPLNPLSPAPELQAEISAIRAKVVLIEPASASWADVDRSTVPSVETVITTEPAAHGGPDGALHLDELLASDPVDRVDVEPDHLAVLIFTSGTAGSPKAAMLTHRNLLSSMDQSLSNPDSVVTGDVVYGVLPLFHIFGLNIVLGLGLRVGATIVLVQRFDPLTAAETIRDRRVTIVPGVPSMWTAFAHFDELDPDTFATVRRALSGASRLPIPVAEAMKERFGVEILEGYGLTEASPTVTTQVGNVVRFGSVGRALAGVEVRLVGNGGDVLVGDVGEIWVRGDNVFPGYFENPEATAAVLTDDGWLKTGDMAICDDHGYLYLVDRAKDLIIVSGFNVYPAEVEEVLARHPDVEEVGVVGVAHPHTGEAVKAFVVAVEGSDVDEETLIEFAQDHLARYKCPSKIMFVDQLPRNASGKLVRRNLDDAMTAG